MHYAQYVGTTVAYRLHEVSIKLSGSKDSENSLASLKAWFALQLQSWLQKWLQQELGALQWQEQQLQAQHIQLQRKRQGLLVQLQQLNSNYWDHRQQGYQQQQGLYQEQEEQWNLQQQQLQLLFSQMANLATRLEIVRKQKVYVLEEAQEHLPAAAVAAAAAAAARSANADGTGIGGEPDLAADGLHAWDMYCNLVRQAKEEAEAQQQQVPNEQPVPLLAVKEVCIIITILSCSACLLPNLNRSQKSDYRDCIRAAAEKCRGQLLGFFDALADVLREFPEKDGMGVYTQQWFNKFMKVRPD